MCELISKGQEGKGARRLNLSILPFCHFALGPILFVRYLALREKLAPFQAKIDAQQLAEELATRKFEEFNVEVTGFTANRVDLKLQSK